MNIANRYAWAFTLLLLATATNLNAQETGTRRLAVLYDWQVEFPDDLTISHDGRFAAHLGPDGRGLYVKSLETGEDKIILEDADGDSYFRDAAFSNDGTHLVFLASAGMTRYYASALYAVRTDGSELTKIVKEQAATEMSKPLYSPDGSQILVRLVAHSNKYVDGHIDDREDRTYIGLLHADTANGNPERLVEVYGNGDVPIFWSVDGGGIYYINNVDTTLYLFDLLTRGSRPIVDWNHTLLLGQANGPDDTFFVLRGRDKATTVLNLKGQPISPDLRALASSIPSQDVKGRRLKLIRAAGPHRLVLVYENTSANAGMLRRHVQLIDFQ